METFEGFYSPKNQCFPILKENIMLIQYKYLTSHHPDSRKQWVHGQGQKVLTCCIEKEDNTILLSPPKVISKSKGSKLNV